MQGEDTRTHAKVVRYTTWYNRGLIHTVQTAQSTYNAIIERGCIARAAEFIPAKATSVFVVTEERVWERYGCQVAANLPAHEVLCFPGGEVNKRLASLEALAEQMVALRADRASVIIAVGGGIVTDVAGFLAAVFMRGIPVIQVPTTLLAQVDASVGGKTGVNLHSGKNLIGNFHQPLAVLIDPLVLASLPDREYCAGLFEIIKCGIIADAGLFDVLRAERKAILDQKPDVLERIISDSVRIKAEVVTADEKESGLRRILNFGHTFAHALEAETEYERFLHGEAVGWGMQAATELSRLEGVLAEPDAVAIQECIDSFHGVPPLDGIDPACIAARLRSDKKTVGGRIHFVLAERIGATRVTADVRDENVLAAIRTTLEA
ncbi:MAG TPA: 3-dehydroquinate synthase [Bryobacteraceae bacterium]|nr:3-dehydroquinate synthase [Bryobacteraceae bacterium]